MGDYMGKNENHLVSFFDRRIGWLCQAIYIGKAFTVGLGRSAAGGALVAGGAGSTFDHEIPDR